jgi:hypothetical protein
MVDFIHTLVIERPFGIDANTDMELDVDEWGQPLTEYDTSFAKVSGLIQPKTDREVALASQAGADVGSHTIYMHRTDITTRDRVVDTTPGGTGGRYQVVGIRDHNFGNLAHLAVDARRVQSPDLAIGS